MTDVNESPTMTETNTDSSKLSDLLKRHGGPAPRYVAYPPPNLWEEAPPDGERARRLRSVLEKGSPLSLYVHVPLCSRLCHYCGCNTTIRPQRPEHGDNFVSHLRLELEALGAGLEARPKVSSLHLGGGTPTFLNEEQLNELMTAIREVVDLDSGGELSLESNPETVTPSQLRTLWELGFTRISFGIQDFNDDTQRAINRRHTFEEVKTVVKACRNVGFSSINFDLVYGLPFQTTSRFSSTVEKVVELSPNRVALYHFAYLPEIKPHQRMIDPSTLPDPEEKFGIFQAASGIFASRGYLPIGMDHFAKPDDALAIAFMEGRLKRSFMGYEANPVTNLLGVGPSAISYLDGAYLRNAPSMSDWGHALDHGKREQDLWRELTEDDCSRHALINDLLCNLELREDAFVRALGKQAEEIVPILDGYVREDLMRREENGWKVTELGRPFVRTIAKNFDAYRNKTPKKARPFSSVS